jgi:hypothetical protein
MKMMQYFKWFFVTEQSEREVPCPLSNHAATYLIPLSFKFGASLKPTEVNPFGSPQLGKEYPLQRKTTTHKKYRQIPHLL